MSKNFLLPEGEAEVTKQLFELNAKYKVDIAYVVAAFETYVGEELLKGRKLTSLFSLAGTAFQMGYNAHKNESEQS